MTGFGAFNKLFLEFDNLFWNPDEHYFGLAPVNQSDMGLLNTWFNMYVITQRPILMGFLAGQNAVDSETWTEDETLRIGSLSLNFDISTVWYRNVLFDRLYLY